MINFRRACFYIGKLTAAKHARPANHLMGPGPDDDPGSMYRLFRSSLLEGIFSMFESPG